MATYEMVIGLEVHVELATKTKIFCGCTTKFGGAPNTHTCPVCTGMPGTLPVANKKVVEFAVAAGLATNCEITRYNKFDRKNYFYPDLPKAYQISQLYLPICRNGHVDIETAAGKKAVGIHEIHMEEDAGKLVHDPWLDETMVDYNRCGVPLLEIVSEPDMRSAEEVIAYLTKLRQTLQYLGVSDCRMQEGSLRADVNLSVRPVGQKEFGTRTEMKNINSFKAIARAIAGEYRRQVELIEDGGQVKQQTRRWDDNKDASFAMRSKENAQDYRYFPEPDLPPMEISQAFIDAVAARASGKPVEFFNGMPIALCAKVRTMVQTAFVADDEAKGGVVTLDKPYSYGGETVSKIDLSGVEELTSIDISKAENEVLKTGIYSVDMKNFFAYSCARAARATGKPMNFFTGLPLHEAVKVRSAVNAASFFE